MFQIPVTSRSFTDSQLLVVNATFISYPNPYSTNYSFLKSNVYINYHYPSDSMLAGTQEIAIKILPGG